MSLRGLLYNKLHQSGEKKKKKKKKERVKSPEYSGTEFMIEEPSGLTVLPKIEDVSDTDVRYTLIKSFADAHIVWDEDNEELVYKVEEPMLSMREKKIFKRLKQGLEEKIETSLSSFSSKEETINYLKEKINSIRKELGIQIEKKEYMKIMYYIYRDFVGLNEIEPLMHDPYIEDIGVDGTNIPIFIVHSKFGNIKTNVVFKDEETLRKLVIKLAERCGKYISYANPIADGSLPDGSRVNASLTEDVTAKGPTFSIRKFQEVPYSAVDMVDLGTANLKMMAYLWFILEHSKSMLISGGTATGKTSFLNSIVTFIPPEEKIVSIEDTRELQLPHENWIPSVARSGYSKGEEENISMYRLLKESFRQNPDYVIVGEVRGEEASVLFQGMSSGHPSLGTMHASSPSTVIKRLVTPPINLSPTLVETLDVIIILNRAKEISKNSRRVQAIYEIEKITEDQSARTNEIFSWTPIDDTFEFKGTDDSVVFDSIQRQFGFSRREIREELDDRQKVLEWMKENGIKNFHKVSKVVSEYYKDKKEILSRIEEAETPFEVIEEEESEKDISEQIQERKREKYKEEVGKNKEEEEESEKDNKKKSGKEKDMEGIEDEFEGEVEENPFED